jgi:regulator of protease activity HflC (stomatin/prohibitin superfamily)
MDLLLNADPGALPLALIVLALVLLLLLLSARTVPQGSEYTVERFGRHVRTLRPGLSLVLPLIDRIGTRMSMLEQAVEIPPQEALTRDKATVKLDGVVFYQVMDAARAAYKVQGLPEAVLDLAIAHLRTALAAIDLEELLGQRGEVSGRLTRVVSDSAAPWGVKVTRIELKELSPPSELVTAIGRQMQAERDRQAQILKAEGAKAGEILRADGEKQAAILLAEGRREAAFRDAEARERLAEAEAKATTLVSDAIARGSVQAVNYLVAQKYVEALAAFAASPQQKTLILPVEMVGIMGSLAGIAELARDALKPSDPAPPPAAEAAASADPAPSGNGPLLGTSEPAN